MDEPCSALDPIATRKIEELMQELKKKYTIAIVTHNLQQAKRVADKTAFLYVDTTQGGRTGYLVEFGDTDRSSRTRARSTRRTTLPGRSVEVEWQNTKCEERSTKRGLLLRSSCFVFGITSFIVRIRRRR